MNGWKLLLLVSLVICGCTRSPTTNLLLITIDTCRADRLGCYGYEKALTPNVDRLAEEGILFTQARTCVPITLPSHVSIMTGQYPLVHGVRENGTYRAPDSLTTLAETLKGAGYRTAAFVGSFPLESRFNLDQGFDYYGDSFGEQEGPTKAAPGGLAVFFAERPANEVNAEFFHWLDDRGGEPFFVWLHYFDPHQPHQPRPPYDGMCADRPYDAEIAFVDESIGAVMARLEKKGLLDRTVIAVTADHGEGLGEHGELTHAMLLYDATMRVPLLIRAPTERMLRGIREYPVRTIDLATTLLALLGVNCPPSMQGIDVLEPAAGGDQGVSDHYLETYYGRLHFGWSVLLGLQSGPWKYIHGPEPELYDTETDPGEISNVIRAHAQEADSLRRKLFSMVDTLHDARHALLGTPDKATMARLEALGYVASWGDPGTPATWFTGRNPMRMMDAQKTFNDAQGLVHQGLWQEAAFTYRRALDADPGNRDAAKGLIHAYTRIGDQTSALRLAQAAVASDPRPEDWLMLAWVMAQGGRTREALDAARRGLAEGADPVESWLLIARCGEAADHSREAADAYAQVLAADASNTEMRQGLARTLAKSGRLAEAEQVFQQALQDNPYVPQAYYNYAVFLYQQDRWDQAIPYLTKAIQLAPDYVPALHVMAITLHDLGRDVEAVPHLERVIREASDPARRDAAEALLNEIRPRRS